MERTDVTRHPLAWPEGWKRTPSHARQASRFTKQDQVYSSDGKSSYRTSRALSFTEACDRLESQVRLFGAHRPVISSNVELGMRGAPLASQGDKQLDDPGVALYFTLKGQARCLACDGYKTPAANIAAIASHIDALRRIDRYGVGTLDQAFAGYAPRLQAAPVEWWIVLGVPPASSREVIDAAFMILAKAAHPDRPGGNAHQMARLTEAREHAYEALEARR